MFLTTDELKQLTGYVRKTEQRKWLLVNGYKFEIDRNGAAKVLKSQVEQRQAVLVPPEPEVEPNFKALLRKKG